ncbi:MAG: helix-turn-helix transcriptional regulator [Prolixibacteraceae bacterium]|nr:helix-turn-helix transcriptional regulator [Prolixibacteraceae bacterium]
MRKNLVQKREECNLKQTKVADFLNITPRHYRQLEAGTSEGRVPIWKKLAQRFNTTIDCLLAQAEETTQGNYNSSGQNGVAEAKELNEAVLE